MEKKKALEIAKKYPEAIKCCPRAAFLEQLADFLIKEKLEDGN